MTDTKTLYCYGPPGTGKTTRLLDIFVKAVESFGPDRVAMVTYTRAAASEAKARAAAHFRTSADKYVGISTIHSACFRMLGSPAMVDGRRGRFKEFCQSLDMDTPDIRESADPHSIDPFWYAEQGQSEMMDFRREYAQAQHEMQPISTHGRFGYLAKKYTAWKEAEGLLDFEDLLVEGAKCDLPVKVLLCDEQQDAGALMWHVVESWARGKVLFVAAGDFYQSIYNFVGADPSLFLNRIRSGQGQVISLGDSHRLTKDSADYAKHLLVDGGHNDGSDLLGTWDGVGTGVKGDGSTFYLARTHRLLSPIRSQLEDAGEPFADLRGYSMLTSADGRAFRSLAALGEGDAMSLAELKHVADRANVPFRIKPGVEYPTTIDCEAVGNLLGLDVIQLRALIPHSAYLTKVYRAHGMRGLVNPPKTLLGTVHSAKGREADVVNLVTSWASLPAQALRTAAGRRSEACVAYVSASRHRGQLNLLDGAFGERYPF